MGGGETELLQSLQVETQGHGSRHPARFKLERCGTDPGGALDVDQRGIVLIVNADLVIRIFRDDDECRLVWLRVTRNACTGYKQETT